MQFERSDQNVGNRVMKGAMFLTGARFILRLFSLVNLVVLGRLLSPDDYGIAALALIVISFIQVFSDVRVNAALIAMDDIDDTLLNTGFTMNMMRGTLIAAILFIFAEPIATFMGEPKLELVLQILCVVLVFDGTRNPAFMMYRRNIDFSREFKRNTAATIFGSTAAVITAVLTQSYWAIVAGTLAERFTEMALSYWRVPYTPRLGLRKWRTFFSFGGWLSAAGIVNYLTGIAPRTMIGKYLGTTPLGFYTIGNDLSQLATRELGSPLTEAIYPGLTALAKDNERLGRAYRKAQSIILGVALPIGVGSALMAQELIAILVGVKWLAASQVIVLLAPTFAFTMITSATDSLAMAKFATKGMFIRALVIAAISLPVYGLALWQWGFMGVLWAMVFSYFLQTAVNMYFAKTLLNDIFFAPLVSGWRSLASAAIMTLAVLLVPAPFSPGQPEYQVFFEMMPRVLLGAATYISVHCLLWKLSGKPDGLESKAFEIIGVIRQKIAERKAAPKPR